MSLFKKPNRKFRQRVAQTDSDEDEIQESPVEVIEKKPKEIKINLVPEKTGFTPNNPISRELCSKDDKIDSQSIPATKLLSFHDDEDDAEVFKLKKSNYSRRLTKQLEKERRKRNELLFKSSNNTESKGSKDQIQHKEAWVELSRKEADDMDVDEDDENKDTAKENPFKNVLQSGIIPDAATIYAMKKHRQMAREMGDFIPLEEPEKDDEHQSRLVRDDDNDDDDDEDDEPSRINFTVNTGAVERQKVREAFLSLQEGANEELEHEDAAELDRWEQEQIRKGVSLIAQGSTVQPATEPTFYPYMPVTEDDSYYPLPTSSSLMNPATMSKPLTFNDDIKSDLTTDTIKARLEERLSALKTSHETHEKELESCGKEMEETNDLIVKLEKEAPEISCRYQLYQQMRGYVCDLVECLDMKVAHIELLDTRLLELYQARAKNLVSRRQMDIRDQSDEFSILSNKNLKGAEISGEKNGGLDEGRLRRAAEREGRRMRRRKQREGIQIFLRHQDGMSSDDEEPDIEVIKFKEDKENIVLESREIFEDVVDDFGTMQGVIMNFEKWKVEEQDSYVQAFVPLCLPKIFGPFIRIEMMEWNPLEDDMDFESTMWYKYLAFYGCYQNLSEDKEDPDINLLPAILERVIAPKLSAYVKDVWDPMSSKQTNKLVAIVKKIKLEYPTNGNCKTIQNMLKAVSERISKCLDDDVYIPLYPKEFLEKSSLGTSIFFQRQFWSSIKLLNNIMLWEGIIAEKPLQDISLSSLVNRYLLMGLNTSMTMRDTLEKCTALFNSLPKSWFAGLKKNVSLPLLKPFAQFLVRFGQSFQAEMARRITVEREEEIKDIVKEIIQMLITLNALDEAVILAKEYSISGFKKDK